MKRAPAPLHVWAVIVQGVRTRCIHRHTLRGTRREAIAAYLAVWTDRELSTWEHWRAKGYTCERVTITVDIT